MEKELDVKLHLYLRMNKDEMQDEAADRLFKLLQQFEWEHPDFSSGEFYTIEVNES